LTAICDGSSSGLRNTSWILARKSSTVFGASALCLTTAELEPGEAAGCGVGVVAVLGVCAGVGAATGAVLTLRSRCGGREASCALAAGINAPKPKARASRREMMGDVRLFLVIMAIRKDFPCLNVAAAKSMAQVHLSARAVKESALLFQTSINA
jgi:hypothetical protein